MRKPSSPKFKATLRTRLAIVIVTALVVATVIFVSGFAQEDQQSKSIAVPESRITLDVTRPEPSEKIAVEPETPLEVSPDEILAAASSANYSFVTATDGTMTDMSTGTTQLLAANTDDTASPLTNFGFDFYFMGIRYTNFSINDNGNIRLGAASQVGNPYQSLAQAATPIITAYGADQRTHTTGKVHFKVIGAAPNRTAVIEWLNMQSNFNSGGTSDLRYQARLSETTGAIEFVYAGMTMSAAGAIDGNSNDPHIGFSSSAVVNTVGSITAPFDGLTTPTFNGTSNDPVENLYTAGPIPVLTSAADGVRRRFTMTPPVPTAPTALTFTGVTASAMTLNWVDSPNDVIYAIYNSTDGTNFSFVGSTAGDATSFAASSLTPSTNYFWRVFAISEGAQSTALAGTQATAAAGNITSAASGNWNTGATWTGGIVPTSTDNVTITDGHTVTIDTNAAALSLTVGSTAFAPDGGGASLVFDGTARTVTIGGDVVVTSGASFTAGASALLTHVLNIGGNAAVSTAAGNLTVNGDFDMNTTAGVTVNFFGSSNGAISGSGATCDFFDIDTNKGTGNVAILDVTRVITIGAPAAAANRLSATNGTFRLSSASVLTPWFGSQTITASGGRLWLNNAGASAQCVGTGTGTGAGSPTFNGQLRMDTGTFGYGSGNNTLTFGATTGSLLMNGGTINMFGAVLFSANAGMTMSAGSFNVDPQAANLLAATTNIFRFTGPNPVLFSGGTVTIVDPHAATGTGRALSISTSSAATYNFTGSTFRFGDGVSSTAGSVDGFDFDTFVGTALVPIWNVTVDNSATNAATRIVKASNALAPFQTFILGDLTITSTGGSRFALNGHLVAFGKNIINNGTIDGTLASSRLYWAGNGVPSTYSGTGTSVAPLLSWDIDNALGVTIDPAVTNVVTRRIILFTGGLTNTNKLTLGNNDATAAVVQVGNTTTPTAAGNLDVAPTFDLGAGGQTISYLRTTTSRTTGPEVNPTRTLNALTYDDNDLGGHTLTIAGGDLTMSGAATALTLNNGRIVTGVNNLILSSGTAAVVRVAGHVDGNYRKTFSAIANKTFEVGTANGYSPVAVNVTAGTFPATFTAKAVQGPQPNFGTPSLALQRYWVLTEGGDVTADLTFNYLDPTDIPITATEANFVIFKYNGAFTMPGGTVSPGTNSASITGVTNFSDWTLAETGATAVPGVLAFNSPTFTSGESAGTATITVQRTGGSDGTVMVDFATVAGGTAVGGASCLAGVDYVNTSGTLTFGPTVTSQTFPITICSDSLSEAGETVNLQLTNPQGGATIGAQNTAVLTITDDDPVPSISITDVSLAEGNAGPTAFSFNVNLSAASGQTVSVHYQTADGTATIADNDYVAIPDTILTFTPGQTTLPVNVTVNGDVINEANETFFVNLVTPTNATISDNQGLGTIQNDDASFVGPVTITATAGTTGPTDYPTVKDAFDAINAGTHQGAVTVNVVTNTTETASAVLNSGTIGPAAYTSVLVKPVGGARTVSGTIAGAIIKLNGADNVTIDGRIAGSGRNLSVTNNSTAAATAAVWLASVVAGNGASNNVIRNLELACGADQRAVTNATFGIIQTGTTISVTSTDGNDNDNNQFLDNRIIRVRYGIVSRGVTTNNNINPVIADNIIGPAAFGIDQIGKVGIYMQADTGATITRNTVQNVGVLAANAAGGSDRLGIAIGAETWDVTNSTTITSGDYTVTRNIIHDVVEEKTFSSIGIRLGTTRSGSPTNNLIANNFIYNIRSDATSGDQVAGIGYAAGHTDRIVFNSISITGDQDPGAAALSTTYGNGIRVSTANAANNVNLTLMDNSIYMDASSSTAATRYYAITLPSNAYVFGTGGLNYNNYYIVPANTQQQTGGLGTGTASAATTQFATLANWQAALTAPQDANSIQADPLHFSATGDLHIGPTSPNINVGLTVAGIVDDIDGQVRPNGANPDIGADEFYASPGTLQFTSSTYSQTETGGTATITVSRLGGINGAAQVDYATVAGGTATGGAACTAGVDYISTSGTLMWGDLDGANKSFNVTLCADGTFEPSETVNLALSNALVATLGTPNTAVLTILDAGSVFNGPVNVGTGQTATSLTNAGGLFSAINSGVVSGNVVINITSDLAGETGAVALNELPGGFTTTIKPSGAARVITGNSSTGMIPFNGTDNVTIDGSTSGGSDRSLTITNAGAGGGIYFATGAAGAQGNTIKNVNIWGGSPTATIIGIGFGGNTFGTAGADNDNNRVENCDLRSSVYGIFSVGASAANKNTGTVLTGNQMNQTGATRVGRIAIFMGFDDGGQITLNNIGGMNSAESFDAIGIGAGSQAIGGTIVTAPADVTNVLISRNTIGFVNQSNTFSSGGIVVGSGTSGTNTVVNNMISGVTGNATSGDAVVGIYVQPAAGATQNIYHNSVSMTGSRGATASQHASIALAIVTDQPVNVINNALMNTQTQTGGGLGGRSYAIATGAATFANLTSNFNDLFVSGAQGTLGMTGGLLNVAGTGTGVDRTDLAAWQAATGKDANSLSVDPLFTSLTDLHLQAISTLKNAGTTGTGVVIDYDGETRPSGSAPDIGADEIIEAGSPGVLAFSSPTYTIGEAGVTASITVNRTSGSTGSVSVDYATVAGGTATGGASCTPGVDYVNASGTLTFPDTNTSQSFNVTICADSLSEATETVNLALTNPTGGATLGAQSTAVLSITDDDPVPTISITDVSQNEGNVGPTSFTFNVNLSVASGQSVTVHYQTNDGSATVANNDYAAIPDSVLTFNPGVTTLPVNVTVNGDTSLEPNETFTVDLSTAVNATIADAQGVGTIVNDEVAPSITINNVRVTEGNSGNVNAQFTVSLTGNSVGPASVHFSTSNGTAVASPSPQPGDDYVTRPDTILNFMPLSPSDGGPPVLTAFVNVTVKGDTLKEANETFYVNLSNATNAIISDPQGVGIIIDDDRAYTSDADHDRKSDYSVFRPSEGVWYSLQTTNGFTNYRFFGTNGDVPVPGDYDGDGTLDLAVFRPSTATWYIERSSDFGFVQMQWGITTDKPVQGDYDGDSKTDIAVFRDGAWYVLKSSDSTLLSQSFGQAGDRPVQGDYDGDAKTDYAVYRNGTWYLLRSTTGFYATTFGLSTDRPVPNDYDGDGSYDIAVFRNGEWYVLETLTGNIRSLFWGTTGDEAVPADYDGDGTSDIAVFRNGAWYVIRSSDNGIQTQFWGTTGDRPVPSCYFAQ
jgi:hypothetical protein